MFTHAATAFLDNPPFPARPSQIDPSSRSRAARYIQQYTDGVFRPVPSPGRLRVERRRYMVEMEDRMQLVAPRWNRGWLLAGRSALEHRAQETGAITQTALQLGVWALSAKNTPLSLATISTLFAGAETAATIFTPGVPDEYVIAGIATVAIIKASCIVRSERRCLIGK